MNVLISQTQGSVPVTIMKLDGKLDGQTYQELITKTKEVYESGSRNFLIDLTDLTYVSSAGLVALHTVTLLAGGGGDLPNSESGWSTTRSTTRAGNNAMQKRVKLVNPREEVRSVLDMVGFSSAFEIFNDLDEAVKSFQ